MTHQGPKHQINRRRFLRLSGGMAGAMALAACAPAPTMLPTPESGAAAGDAAEQLAGELVISIAAEVPDEAQQALAEAYKMVRPNVDIIWEMPNLDAGEYPQWLGTQLAAGNVRPDIVSGNYFKNFDDYVNFDRYRTLTNPHTGNQWDNDLDWDAWRELNAQGEIIARSLRSVHTYWFYNKEIFSEVGVEPPTTWEEFADVSAQLADAGYTPIGANYIWQVPQWLAAIYFDQYHLDWIETVRAQPGDWNYDPNIDGEFEYDPSDPFIHSKYTYNIQRFYKGLLDGELRFDTPQIADLVRNKATLFPEYTTEDFFIIGDPYPPFLQQQVAMMCNGTWVIPVILRDMESLSPERLEELGIENLDVSAFEWGTFENPSMTGELVDAPAKAVESAPGPYLSIIEKNQQQVDLALDFLMFWTSVAGYQPFLDGQVASGEFAPAGPLLVRDVEEPPEYAELWQDLEFTGNAEVNYNNFWTSASGAGDYRTDLRNLYKSALEGDLSPEAYAEELQAYVEENLEGIVEQAGLTMEDVRNPAKQPGT